MIYRDWKKQQLGEFGDVVPVVRCMNHGPSKALSISMGGQIFWSFTMWEHLFTTAADSVPEKPPSIVGKIAAPFTLKDINGKEVSLSDFKGNVVLLDFWATWCGPCRRAIPHLEALHKKYKDQGLVVIGMNHERNHDKVKEFASKQISYIVLLDADEQFKEYNISSIPTAYYIDIEGKIRYRDVGFGSGTEKDIEKKVKELILEVRRPQASWPQPANGADLTPVAKFKWIPGLDAVAHNVYFGTDPKKLKLLGRVEEASYTNLPPLERRRWYCWRIDTVKSDGSVVKGNLWSFSTGKLVGWWKFDETEGRRAVDSSGNGNDGTLKGDPQWQPGRVDGALLFDGDGDYVAIGNESNFDITGSITVAAWIKVNAFDKDWQAIVTKGEDAWRLHRNKDTNTIKFNCNGLQGLSPWPGVTGSVDVNDGQWHHVAGVYDGPKLYLYVNGELDNSEQASGSIATNNSGVCIGENVGIMERYWNGLIDDVRIYSYALSEAEIKVLCFETKATRPQPTDGATVEVATTPELRWVPGADVTGHKVYFGTKSDELALLAEVVSPNYAKLPALEKDAGYYWRIDGVQADGSVAAGNIWSFTTSGKLVGWWKLDDDAKDSSPYQHHGNEMGNPGYATGMRGRALSLRGDGDHVLVPDIGAYLNGLDVLTLCLWVKSSVTATDKGFIIFEEPDENDNRDMRYDAAGVSGGGTNLIKCGVTSDADEGPEGSPGRQQLESSSNIQTTDWQHLAMTWSSGNRVALYINGKLDTPTWIEPGLVGALVGYTKLIIGKGGRDTAINKSWNGLIDDVRIYNYALSEAEMKALCLGTKATKPQPTDGATVRVATTPELRWVPGADVTGHKVYFGTKSDELALLAEVASPNYAKLPALEKDTVYYWRIDGVQADGSVATGDIWSFTTSGKLVGWWKFDQIEGRVAVDSSSHGNHGTLQGQGDPKWVSGIIDGALELDGDDFVRVDGVADDITSTNITISIWIKTTQGDEGEVFASNDSANRHPFMLGIQGGNPYVNDGGDTQFPPSINDGQWHMLTYVRSGNEGYVYVDGAQRGMYSAGFDLGSVTRWSIGQEWDNATPSNFYVGTVDDARIYSYALSEAERKAVYASQGPGPTEPN